MTDRTGDSSCRQVLRRRLPDCLVGRVSESAKYDSLGKNLKTAFEFLRKTDLPALSDGRTVVDGKNVYVNVMSLKLKPFNAVGGHLPNRCLASPAEGYRKAVVKVLV